MCTEACTHDRRDVMPVITIDTKDFLVPKNSGDVVTGADWNKLVSLFHAFNGNAKELLDTIKNVDINTANIAQVTQGAVPDGSIEYAKLSKMGGITKKYILTTDTTPKAGTTYYTLEGNAYVPHTGLTAFTTGVQYYILETRATTAAIADGDVIGDGVLEDYHLADHTLLPRACSEFLLGGLLNDSATVYTDKGVSGSFAYHTDMETYIPTPITHTIQLDKSHKTVVIIQPGGIIILNANPDKPNLFIGGYIKLVENDYVYGGMYISHLIGTNKSEQAPQGIYTNSQFSPGMQRASYPTGLLSPDVATFMQLRRCYYDSNKGTITVTISHLPGNKYHYPAQDYSFGNLIIGL